MKVLVLLNQSAGTLAASQAGDEPTRIREGFQAHGVEADVQIVEGAKLEETAKRAINSDVDAVVAGGGDGTLNTIAAALAGSDKAFGVLPLGTHNHFAKELGLPLTLDDAVAALATGRVTDLDVGEVNGHLFLNFSGLGLHPAVIRHRDAQREVLGRKKFVAMAFAFVAVLRRMPVMRVHIRAPAMSLRRVTPSVIVCNNEHQMKVFGVENVSRADRGVLNVYVARSTAPFALVGLIVRAMFRALDSARNFESLAVPEATIATRRRTARVSIDGEVMDMDMPLQYRVRRGGLKVIVPAETVASG